MLQKQTSEDCDKVNKGNNNFRALPTASSAALPCVSPQTAVMGTYPAGQALHGELSSGTPHFIFWLDAEHEES